jgi:hypothetical protein
MESRGNKDLGKEGVQSMGSSLHWGSDSLHNAFQLTHAEYSLEAGDFSQDFHIFGLFWDERGLYTYVDTEDNKVLKVDFTEESFAQRAAAGGKDLSFNPWQYSTSSNPKAAPFDQQFFIIFNVAVGGVSGYFPDTFPNKPWSDKSSTAAADFWANRAQWLPSWGDVNSDENAMVIDWIRVYSVPTSQYKQLGRYAEGMQAKRLNEMFETGHGEAGGPSMINFPDSAQAALDPGYAQINHILAGIAVSLSVVALVLAGRSYYLGSKPVPSISHSVIQSMPEVVTEKQIVVINAA